VGCIKWGEDEKQEGKGKFARINDRKDELNSKLSQNEIFKPSGDA